MGPTDKRTGRNTRYTLEVKSSPIKVRNTGGAAIAVCSVKGPLCEARLEDSTIQVELVDTGEVVPCYISKTRVSRWVEM